LPNHNIKKLKAFTLSEMLVVLLVTTIVVGLAYSVLRLIQNQMHGIGQNYEHSTEFNLLRQSLWVDFNSHNNIAYREQEGMLWFVHEMDTVVYELANDFIRKQRDTFYIQLQDRQAYFRTQPQKLGPIDALELKSTVASGSQRLFVFRRNDAARIMNQ